MVVDYENWNYYRSVVVGLNPVLFTVTWRRYSDTCISDVEKGFAS